MSPSELEAYFLPIAEILRDFARDQGILLIKYRSESYAWSLCFGHPAKGQAVLDLYPNDEKTMFLHGIRWYDDFTTFRRYTKGTPKMVVNRTSSAILESINGLYHEMLAWGTEEWDGSNGSFKTYWSGLSPLILTTWPIPTPASLIIPDISRYENE